MGRWVRRVVGGAAMVVALAAGPASHASGMDQASDTPTATGPFRCSGGEIAGVPAEDAGTAVDIVCRELASVSGSAGSFVVSLRPLGPSLVLTVSRAGAAGGRSLVLDGFKEVPTAARRLADALIMGMPIEGTRRVDNLVESEGRPLVSRPGSRKFQMGALGMAAGHGTLTGAGFSLGFAYDTPAFAIPAELRFAHSGDGEKSVSLFSIDTGARYYLSRRHVSSFVGGGLSMLFLSYSEMSYEETTRGSYSFVTSRSLDDSRWGPGLYAEAGLQLFRLHRGRMTAKVRADFPMLSLNPRGYEWSSSGREVALDRGSLYVVPITFGLTGSF
jgi:hypothetical protein